MSPLAAWAAFWEGLRPSTIPQLRHLCVPEIRFIDPFNDLVGVDRMERLLIHMFDTVTDPRFMVEDQAMGAKAGYLRWRFTGVASGRAITLEGMSEIRFAADGKVILHQDHWDAGAQIYGHVPLLGAGIRFVRRRLSLPA